MHQSCLMNAFKKCSKIKSPDALFGLFHRLFPNVGPGVSNVCLILYRITNCKNRAEALNTLYLWCVSPSATAPMVEEVEEVVEAVVLTRATVSPLGRVTASRATEATTRARTAALAPTTREDTAATANPSQVDTLTVHRHTLTHSEAASFNCVSCVRSLRRIRLSTS